MKPAALLREKNMLDINSRLELNNGRSMPRLGLGVWRISDRETAEVVGWALEAGYRLIDTASYYQNEKAVGQGLRDSGLPREDLFITSKVWNDSQGYEKTLRSCAESLDRLGLDYLDLYLIHWPVADAALAAETWRALEKIYHDGLARSIGVSNFNRAQFEALWAKAEIKPVLNQVELHPLMAQTELRAWSKDKNLAVEAYAPLARGRCFDEPLVMALARKHGKSPAQIILRWHLQNGIAVIPKSISRSRILENAALFDFSLSEEEIASISGLDRHKSVLSTVFPANDEGYVIA